MGRARHFPLHLVDYVPYPDQLAVSGGDGVFEIVKVRKELDTRATRITQEYFNGAVVYSNGDEHFCKNDDGTWGSPGEAGRLVGS